MAWTQTDLDSIEQAISGGTKRVRFADGREAMYQDITQMLAARDAIRQSLAEAAVPPINRAVRVVTVRDF